MTEILYEYITMFGLDYQPLTFADMFAWLVLVMCAMAIVCGILRVMFEICSFSIKGGFRR